MFSEHDPSIAPEEHAWPAPAGSSPVYDLDPPHSGSPSQRRGRRRLALAAFAAIAIAAGTAGGAIAGHEASVVGLGTREAPGPRRVPQMPDHRAWLEAATAAIG